MIKKIIKLFGLKIFEVVKYDADEEPTPRLNRREMRVNGAVIDDTPEDEAKDIEKHGNP